MIIWHVSQFEDKDGLIGGWIATEEGKELGGDDSIIAPTLEELYTSVEAWYKKFPSDEPWQLIIPGN